MVAQINVTMLSPYHNSEDASQGSMTKINKRHVEKRKKAKIALMLYTLYKMIYA